MDSTEHRKKATRIVQEQKVLDRVADHEMWLEATMHRATHVLNAALHEEGTTALTEDLIHVGMPREVRPADMRVATLMEGLRAVEMQRAFHVRGPMTFTPGLGDLLDQLEAACDALN